LDQEKHNEGIEIWGGAESSVVRINNSVYDQIARTGFEEGTDDLQYFFDLGIRTIRYPLLWEKCNPNEKEFFSIHDERLSKLQDLGITPIAGLLHHGSGPFHTNLADPHFPELLAEYAMKIAERYPWINYYTPVNEPLTTARFAGLYGVWYPHLRDGRSFARIFLNELKGTILAMDSVKRINPGAKLIQTEDLGRILSTSMLSYQATFENHRRWLTWDFLLGRVDNDHPLRKYFSGLGITDEELDFFVQNKIEPAVCGFNYYVTSERYLDHRKTIYPRGFHGGNGLHEYADVELVRANVTDNIGSYELMREAWERYHLPIALTEVHLACTREEQLRWFYEAWQNAVSLKKEGVDFRAITAWSFFGSYDWNSLMCIRNNVYESGIYDVRSGKPRPTALASLIKSINCNEEINMPLLKVPGWWKRKDRMIYKSADEENVLAQSRPDSSGIAPLLIIGGGSLAIAMTRICRSRGIVYHLSSRNEVDIASEEAVNRLIEEVKPWGVINAAGFTNIDEAEKSPYICFRENTIGAVILSEACRKAGIRYVTFSSDQVFNGKKKKPYIDDDHTDPLNLYGMSKKFAEENIMKVNPDSLIVRSGTFFNPWSRNDFLVRLLNSSGTNFRLPSDIIISPSYIPDLGNTVLDLMIDGQSGIWHLSSQDEISISGFAIAAFRLAGLDERIISPVPFSSLKHAATRPSYSVLKSSQGIVLPVLNKGLESFIDELKREPALETIRI
jgi:dTDP-4-dehydrorhamnose reductase